VNVSLIGDSAPGAFVVAFLAATGFAATFFAATFFAGAAAALGAAFVAAFGAAFLAAVFAEVGMVLLPVVVSVMRIRARRSTRITAGFYKRRASSCESFCVLHRFLRGFL
jgi:hypothetical protein